MARQSSPKDDGSDQCRSRRRHGRSETSRGRSTGWIGSSCWFNPSPRTRSRISTTTTGPSRSKRVLEGEVFIEVDGQARVCRSGEMGVVPAGAVHGFRGLGAPGLLEVFGEQHAGTVFLLADGGEIEVHRPGVPWDRPGPATDMAALASRLIPPSRP
jgi:hypothetical protein